MWVAIELPEIKDVYTDVCLHLSAMLRSELCVNGPLSGLSTDRLNGLVKREMSNPAPRSVTGVVGLTFLAEPKESGRWFHTTEPVIEKALSPNFLLVHRTI